MKSGAMMAVISLRSLVTSRVGMTPSVVPLLGSTAVSGTGSTGQVVGFSQLTFCLGPACLALGAGIGPITFGALAGDVAGGDGAAWGASAVCAATAWAARQKAAAISPGAARAKRLGLCLSVGSPRVSFKAISTLFAGVEPRPHFAEGASMARKGNTGAPTIISASRTRPHARAASCSRRRLIR